MPCVMARIIFLEPPVDSHFSEGDLVKGLALLSTKLRWGSESRVRQAAKSNAGRFDEEAITLTSCLSAAHIKRPTRRLQILDPTTQCVGEVMELFCVDQHEAYWQSGGRPEGKTPTSQLSGRGRFGLTRDPVGSPRKGVVIPLGAGHVPVA
ncbi:hypothetical protein BaRGS_00002600 [Batillaria attramentaria]|uniref:Uncharacterized protein n=1 Tax=Batillaria attramentaria TaxID=370345 RepID=A0ABD0M503_9CAEN